MGAPMDEAERQRLRDKIRQRRSGPASKNTVDADAPGAHFVRSPLPRATTPAVNLWRKIMSKLTGQRARDEYMKRKRTALTIVRTDAIAEAPKDDVSAVASYSPAEVRPSIKTEPKVETYVPLSETQSAPRPHRSWISGLTA